MIMMDDPSTLPDPDKYREALKSQLVKIWKIKSGRYVFTVGSIKNRNLLLLINSKDVWRQTSHALLIVLEALLLFLCSCLTDIWVIKSCIFLFYSFLLSLNLYA